MKWQIRLARMISNVAVANFTAGHILRPDPNGNNRKSFPCKSEAASMASSMDASGAGCGCPPRVRTSPHSAALLLRVLRQPACVRRSHSTEKPSRSFNGGDAPRRLRIASLVSCPCSCKLLHRDLTSCRRHGHWQTLRRAASSIAREGARAGKLVVALPARTSLLLAERLSAPNTCFPRADASDGN